MAYRKSRLSRLEEARALKSTAKYVVLSVGLIAFLFVFGVPFLSSASSFALELVGREPTSNAGVTSGPPPSPPRINTPPSFTNEDNIRIAGNTRPGIAVSIFFNGEKKEVISNAQGDFSSSFPLKVGENTVHAKVTDNAGRESMSSSTYTIVFDKEPPELEIIAPSANEFYGARQEQVKVEGQTEPAARVTINEHIVVVRSDGKFDYSVNLSEGENKFTIKATDQAGNETEAELTLTFYQ